MLEKANQKRKESFCFIIAALIMTTFFTFSRLPLIFHFPFVYFHPDYIGYFSLVDQIDKGFWPLFSIRTPGYPLFLKLIFLFVQKNGAVIIVQNLLSLISSLIFLKALQKTFFSKTLFLILASVLLSLFIFSGTHILNDFSLVSDSLATNLQITALTFILLAIKLKNNNYFLIGASLINLAVFVRPATIYLYFLAALTSVFIFFNKQAFSRKILLSFLLPLLIIPFLLCLYNFFTIKSFSITTLSEHMLLSHCSFFLEKDTRLPEEINHIIEEVKNFLPQEEKMIVQKSWNLNDLYWVLCKNFDLNRVRIIKKFLNLEPPDSYLLYMKWRPVFRKIIIISILKNFNIYFKVIITNLYHYFRLFQEDEDVFFSIISWKNHQVNLLKNFIFFSNPSDQFYRRFCSKKYAQTVNKSFLKNLTKEFYPILKLKDDKPFELKERITYKVYRFIYWDIYRRVARNYFWLISLLVFGISSLTFFWKTKFKSEESFFFLLLAISPIIHAILISTSGISNLRYAYQLEFIYYLSPLFLFLLIQKHRNLNNEKHSPEIKTKY